MMYDQYYSDRVDIYHSSNRVRTRWDFAVDRVSHQRPHSLLDFGCGDGVLFNKFKALGVRRIIGIDSSSVRLNRVKVNAPYAETYFGLDELTGKTIDAIVCLDVLDHIYNPVELLQGFHDVLRKDGKLIGSVPNFTRVDRRLKVLMGEIPTVSSGTFIDGYSQLIDGGKVGYYSPKKMRELLLYSGFRNVKFYFYGSSLINSYSLFSGTISWTAQK